MIFVGMAAVAYLVGYLILSWIHSAKEDRVQRAWDRAHKYDIPEFETRRELGGYQVSYSGILLSTSKMVHSRE